MIKKISAIAIIALSGCSANQTASGDTFTSTQARQVQTVIYGTLVSVRPVTIQGGDGINAAGAIGGALVGGFLGNTVGGGRGRNLATATGVVGGAVAGQKIQNSMNLSSGVELEVRRDDGTKIIVVQAQGASQFHPGQRVAVATLGNTVTVSPR